MPLTARSSAAAATLARRCLSSVEIPRHGASLPSGNFAGASVGSISSCCNTRYSHYALATTRPLSSMPPPPTAAPPDAAPLPQPTSLTPDAGLGAQDAMKLFIQHGLGKQKLQLIADEKDAPLVDKWQRMIATFLETQCHVIALLGYQPDEKGIAAYTQHLTEALRLSPPETQEKLRVAGRDTYRLVLAGAFDLPNLLEEQKEKGELEVVDARNIMHAVSLKMQSPEVLEKVAQSCNSGSVAMNDGPEAQQIEMARKHTVVQHVMVDDVYLAEGESGESLVKECGFGDGEEGYVRMQSAMAEHQGDPLIAQYVGASMVKLLQSAGIDVEALQRQGQPRHQEQSS